MKYDDFLNYLSFPTKSEDVKQEEVQGLLHKYPYFNVLRWIYLRSLQGTDSIYFENELKKATAYSGRRRSLFYFMHPEENKQDEHQVQREAGTGSYFDMLDRLEERGENNENSLSVLAARLKKAREQLSSDAGSVSDISDNEKLQAEVSDFSFDDTMSFESLEQRAKMLIRSKKYPEAIAILEKLNLINPKKSIYFADQIRYLKRIQEEIEKNI